jgi:hypothetical protein
MDEYVPTKTPRIKAKLNPLIISPPKINKANKTNKVVKDVTTVLPKFDLVKGQSFLLNPFLFEF